MKNIEIENKQIQISTDLTQLSLKKFEKAINIFQKSYDMQFEKFIDLIEVMTNLTPDDIEDLHIDDFKKIVDIIENIEFTSFEKKFINQIEIDGITYKSKSDGADYKFSVREIFLMQDILEKNPENYLLDLIAIVFREVDAEGNLIGDLKSESIEKRKEVFKDIKMDVVGPYLSSLSEYFLTNINAK
jgi:hypothetical protein